MDRSTPCRRAARCCGFTLVELLVALAVMALLSLMSWRGIEAMGRAQAQTQARADAVQAMANGLAQWGADLDAMVSEPEGVAGAHPVPEALDWNGQALRITRSATAGEDGLMVVAWMLGAAQGQPHWLRWQSPPLHTRSDWQQAWQQAAEWAQSPGGAQAARQTVVLPASGWQVYYYRGEAWSNPASSSEDAARIPDGVRLELLLAPGQPLTGTLRRDWIRPTAVGAKS